MLLYPVTGDAKVCAPCAWSALTGLSTDTWPDEAVCEMIEHHRLDRLRWENNLPWYVADMEDGIKGVALADFREPGRWSLTLAWPDDPGSELHAVAVAVEGSTRVIADNHIREPLPLAKVVSEHAEYRAAVVTGGVELVPTEPLFC